MGLTPESEPTGATLGDVVARLRQIADVLESQHVVCGEQHVVCGEEHESARCGLLPLHKGYHITADGRIRWLEEE